jgi:hypothetical protein
VASEPPVNVYRVRYSDRARRMADGIRQAFNDHGIDALDQWMAFNFSDGKTDGHIYPNKATAVRFQFREDFCCYVCLAPDMGERECESYIKVHEQLYKQGLRIADPEKPVHYEPHQRQEEWKNQGLVIPKTFPRNLRPR